MQTVVLLLWGFANIRTGQTEGTKLEEQDVDFLVLGLGNSFVYGLKAKRDQRFGCL